MSHFRELTGFLKTHGGTGQTSFGGWSIVRVGRNPVWRAQNSRQEVFVKSIESNLYFQRELHGLELTKRLSENHDWISAPDVLYEDEGEGVVVMSALPGTSMGRLFKAAFRVDRNPLRRRRRINEFLNGVRSIVRWIAALGEVSTFDRALLFDHTVESCRARVVSKLRRASKQGILTIAPGTVDALLQVQLARPHEESILITGDASLGNFIWNGRQIGRIDFEDFGFGSPRRDFLELRESLGEVQGRLWYWSTKPALALVPQMALGHETAVYRLEWALDRLWHAGVSGARVRMRGLRQYVSEVLGNDLA